MHQALLNGPYHSFHKDADVTGHVSHVTILVHFTPGWFVWHSLAGFCGRNASAGEVSDDINKKVCWIISIWRWRLCTSAPETPSFPPEWRNLTQLLAGGRHPDKYTTIGLLIYTKYLGLHDTNNV